MNYIVSIFVTLLISLSAFQCKSVQKNSIPSETTMQDSLWISDDFQSIIHNDGKKTDTILHDTSVTFFSIDVSPDRKWAILGEQNRYSSEETRVESYSTLMSIEKKRRVLHEELGVKGGNFKEFCITEGKTGIVIESIYGKECVALPK